MATDFRLEAAAETVVRMSAIIENASEAMAEVIPLIAGEPRARLNAAHKDILRSLDAVHDMLMRANEDSA